ncbi:response regulator [Nocardioides daphniae]|uniref:DNA-binding response regulator n=1 Tax=Nocardioides daphniae TaxID=402297 RepID=A0ABQ1Q4Y2_9ACTN|nr:response regulator transcription factor [Nocardioides daphniae]GGD12936.1 DNA-binding response regulator [Nocardioides daphniae]
MAEVRIAVVDDHPVFRLGLVALLRSLPDFDVVAEAASHAEALEVVDDAVDVVLMDLHLGAGSGIEATRDLVRRHPGLKVLVVTMQEDDDSVAAAMRAGAHGYLLKSAAPDALERAVRAVTHGEMILGPGVAERALAAVLSGRGGGRVAFPELTDREREVLDLLARGHDNPTIARRLVLSPKTVRNHVSNVLAKIGAADRTDAVIRARDAGLGQD